MVPMCPHASLRWAAIPVCGWSLSRSGRDALAEGQRFAARYAVEKDAASTGEVAVRLRSEAVVAVRHQP